MVVYRTMVFGRARNNAPVARQKLASRRTISLEIYYGRRWYAEFRSMISNSNIVYTGFPIWKLFIGLDLETGDRKVYPTQAHSFGRKSIPLQLADANFVITAQSGYFILGWKQAHAFHESRVIDWEAISWRFNQWWQRKEMWRMVPSLQSSESPFKFGLIYAGTDDGLLHVTTKCRG